MISPEAKKIEATIIHMEARGKKDCHQMHHPSGEIGCRGYLTSTWKAYANIVIGYVPERTPVNERYVTLTIIQRWIDNGKSAEDIFLTWNQGNHGACRKGVNKHGVRYNSCEYVRQALYTLNKNLIDS